MFHISKTNSLSLHILYSKADRKKIYYNSYHVPLYDRHRVPFPHWVCLHTGDTNQSHLHPIDGIHTEEWRRDQNHNQEGYLKYKDTPTQFYIQGAYTVSMGSKGYYKNQVPKCMDLIYCRILNLKRLFNVICSSTSSARLSECICQQHVYSLLNIRWNFGIKAKRWNLKWTLRNSDVCFYYQLGFKHPSKILIYLMSIYTVVYFTIKINSLLFTFFSFNITCIRGRRRRFIIITGMTGDLNIINCYISIEIVTTSSREFQESRLAAKAYGDVLPVVYCEWKENILLNQYYIKQRYG